MEHFAGMGGTKISFNAIRIIMYCCKRVLGNCVRGMIYAMFAIYLPQLLCVLYKYCICVRFDVDFPGKIRLSSAPRLTFRNLCVKSDCFT